VQRGQKTGCYLDQRDNRLAASRYLSGAHVLDAFCFSGGFGITALKSGNAESVTGIDSSEAALTLARNNAVLNGVAERCGWIHEDVRTALDKLAAAGRLFDGVILDPPRMARSRGGLERALQGYIRLNEAGLRVLKPGGILVTCSCSGLVSRNDFAEVIAETARRSGRNIQILEHHGQPADHPVSATCPETEYLKVLICRVL
jgi:23S rRNA (cytosine1962-C5)-methyltransferase